MNLHSQTRIYLYVFTFDTWGLAYHAKLHTKYLKHKVLKRTQPDPNITSQELPKDTENVW